jgi:hypothetical protein
MKHPNKMAAGLSAWLTFEKMCNREALFSESFLTYPIAQLLSARYGSRLLAEHPHPVLAPARKGRGDKPRLDFAVLRPDATVEIAIETKWLSSSKTLQRDIIRDMIRLELVAHAHSAETWLIVAGLSGQFTKLTNRQNFLGHPRHLNSNSVLPLGRTQSGNLRLNPPAKFRRELLSSAVKPFLGQELPSSIVTTRFGPYPKESSAKDFVTCLWRIERRHQVARFNSEDVFGAAA